LLGNGSANTPVARHKHATIPEPSLSNVPIQQWKNYSIESGVFYAVHVKDT
jgi:hypothetical protein